MNQRPNLTQSIRLDAFKNHYWLKVELVNFCKNNGLSVTGSKEAITHRIETFLTTGKKVKPTTPSKSPHPRDSLRPITLTTPVIHYKNDAATRKFFVSQVGAHFHFDAYLRQFTNKDNITKGLTYGDLVNGWLVEENKRKNPDYQTDIGHQFEYNRFTRDFFAHEKNKSRSDAIRAWNLIKALPGERTYAHYQSILSEQKNPLPTLPTP